MISIVIPVYNEENEVINTISSLHAVIKDIDEKFEIIAVNDGSTDTSLEKLKEMSEKYEIIVINNEKNRGYGYSLKKGIKHAAGEYIVITDADGTYPAEFLPQLIEKREQYEMIVAARTGANVNIPIIRRPAKKFLNILANYLSGEKIPDLNSGYRIFKKSTILKYFSLLPDGFSFTTTSTLSFLCNAHDILYLPSDYMKRTGSSKIDPVKDTLNFILLIIRTILYFNPLKVFLPISIFIFLLGVSILYVSFMYFEQVMDITVIVCILSSIQIAAIGFLADVIVKRSELKE